MEEEEQEEPSEQENQRPTYTEEELRKIVANNSIEKPNFLGNEIMSPGKNCAFAFIKEFFVKHEAEEVSTRRVFDLLAEDCDNMMKSVRSQTERNSEEIRDLSLGQQGKNVDYREMVSKFSRLNESVKAIIQMDKREKIMWADLHAVKHETLTAQKYLGDKLNIHNNRMVEFEVRVARLENHCFVNFEKMTKQNDQLL